ncbi:MAG: MFS transporter [Deltaproteobacteria bacterium]|nr:MFS transporter [Deltaproteobacteria bacterium]
MNQSAAPVPAESRPRRRRRLVSMGLAYALGAFNDNFFKQAALCLAAIASLEWMQGVAAALFALPFVLFSAWGGWLADAFPKKLVIVRAKYLELGAMLLGAFALCATGFIPHWWGMTAVVFLMGLQSTFFSPALNGAIPEHFPAPEVPRVNALLKLATTATILLGFSLAGVVLELPTPAFMLPWLPDGQLAFGRAAIGVFAALVSVIGIFAAYGIGGYPGKERPKAAFPWLGPVDSFRHALQCRRSDIPLYLALVGEAFFYGVSSFILLCLPNLGIRLGFSLTVTSLLSVALTVGICTGAVLAGRHEARVWRSFMRPAGLGMALGITAAAFAPFFHAALHLPWLLAAFALAGICGGLYLIPLVSFIQIRPPVGEKGKVLGISNFASFSAILLSGLVFAPLGFLHPALLLACASLAIFVFLAWAGRRLRSLPEKTLADTRGSLLGLLLRLCVGLRYKVTTRGLEKIAAPDKNAPILFLPNHPALIDPIIVYSQLAAVRPRPLADENQMGGFLGSLAAGIVRAVRIPDLRKHGFKASHALQTGMALIPEALRSGDSVLLYPSGRIYRAKRENIGGNSGTAAILHSLPGVRVVLIRTTGLWGSAFSYAATGNAPSLVRELLRGAGAVFANLVFFTPRREVTMEFIEPDDMPRDGDKRILNRWLEAFYHEAERPAMAVPRFFWQGKAPCPIEEFSERDAAHGDVSVAPAVREAVYAALREAAKLPADHPISDGMHLAADLGLDSLGIMELSLSLEAVQGIPLANLESLITVQDCLTDASGKPDGEEQTTCVPEGWFAPPSRTELACSAGAATIPDAFLALVRDAPCEPLCAERASLRTRRDILTGALVLSGNLRSLPGQRIGIMLPSTPAVVVVWLASLLAGKTPVFLNWTVGESNMRHCVTLAGVSHVLTASALLERLERQGFVAENIPVTWLPLEKTAKALGLARKIGGALKARFLRSFAGYPIPEAAAVLFTSGSESLPKGVPLTHANLMANARDAIDALQVKHNDTLLAMLPPFHSFGLMVGIVLPLTFGLRTAYYPNPTEAGPLNATVRDFRLSLLAAAPTFLEAMLERARGTQDLAPLRYAFVGAEKCLDRVYRAFSRQCPDAALCEGYGITECSPVVSVNRTGNVVPGSIGHALASVDTAVVREEDGRILGRAAPEETGMLLVRGPSIFGGYLGDVPSPFVAFENETWYRTGDLVSRDASGRFFFQGRLKRFVKIGGEMISLPQIEERLLAAFASREDAPAEGPALAVEAAPEENGPGIVLFTPMMLSAKDANAALRASGLSALYSVHRVLRVAAIPLLGSGKTDYRGLKKLLRNTVQES